MRRPVVDSLNPPLTDRLDETVDALLEYYPSISAAIAIPGEGIWSTTRCGSVSDCFGEPMLFQIASISKVFTAAIILQLVEEGQLHLTDTIEPWFLNVPWANQITITQLLNHTSGIVSFNALPDGTTLDTGYQSPDELIAIATDYDLLFNPGEGWAYSNTNYVMLGKIIESIEEQSFHDVLTRRILHPLNLEDTILRRPNMDELSVIAGHRDGQRLNDEFLDEEFYAKPYAAGALASTAKDLVVLWHGFLSGALVSPSMVQFAFGHLYPMSFLTENASETRLFYGMGVQVIDSPTDDQGPGLMLGHLGGMPGFNALVAYVAESDVYIAIAVNDEARSAGAGLWSILQTLRSVQKTH